jgi:hypothetical protein
LRHSVSDNSTAVGRFGAYTYDYAQSPVTPDSVRWQANGTASFNSSGVTFPGSGGSLISLPAISGTNPADYEIKTTLAIPYGSGTYILFFRTDSAYDQSGGGSYVSVELTVGGPGYGAVVVNQRTGGSSMQISGGSVALHDGITFRATIQGACCGSILTTL